MTTADLVILGGGSGGYAAAFRAAALGRSVILIEKEKLGGTCLHRGCIPTKALLHAAEVADTARTGGQFGVRAAFEGVDLTRVHAYKDSVVSRLHRGLQSLAEAHDVTVIEGRGTFVGGTTVDVGGMRCTGRNLVLATGSHSKSLPGLELGERIITSEEALRLDYIPEKVVVLGGGVIGVEFASVWASFGAEVTIVEALPRLLPAEDEFSSRQLERALRRRGVRVKTGVKFTGARQDEHGVRVALESGDTLACDVLLVAVGRGPNTAGHGYEASGLELERGFVATDERLRTNLPGVYAVGDIVAGPQLAHRGFAQGVFVAEAIAGLNPPPIDEAGIPRVTFSRPEVASVGLTEAAAGEKYATGVTTLTYDLAGNGKSQILKTTGAVKLVKAPDGRVVGLHMVGDRVGELIGEAQLIYNLELLPEQIAPLIHAHPTQSEALGEAHLALAGKPLHTHG
ncbi:dihydrolipoyl dehydrogenase [Streptomyces olivaceoviridis]|uniref:dihydrolipoyl dehydrogenase n=1 Tax=Streptomyces olivaceoviridis TaxID=1921 RepID=UPI0033286C0C